MKRILVIRFSALGDVALLVPVVRVLAEQYPEVEITVLSQNGMADLFADLPANVRFYGVDTKRQSLQEIVASLGTYDLVADMHGVWRSMYVRWRIRLRGARVATIDKGRWEKFLLTNGWQRGALTSTIRRYEKVLQDLGLSVKCPLTVSIKCYKNELQKQGIGIAPFAAHEGKMYPLDQMEQVVRLLSERGEKIVLFGSKNEADVLETWAKRYESVESVAGKKRLSDELELMRNLRVMVTMDSANMHLASLVGTRVVSIWGATHPNAGFLGWGQSESDCIQRDLDCRPCSVYGNKRCKYGDYRCLAIKPEEIVERLIKTDAV